LAEVDAGGTDVGLAMVAEGDAIATSDARPEVLEAEESAAGQGIGLWADDVCGASGPPADIELGPIDANPPGPDEDGETVRIENRSDSPIDLTGFVLRDESSVNRYAFREGTSLGTGAAMTITTACGDDTAELAHWCSDQPIWNNGGDLAMLLDGFGRVVAFSRY
jgi:hypothetical protein